MPGGFPAGFDICAVQGAIVNGTIASMPAQISSGSAGVKGAYTTLIASTTTDVVWMMIDVYYWSFSASADTGLIDIAIGASGSEIVLIPNLVVVNPEGNNNGAHSIAIPLSIPAGTRISARSQTGLGSMNMTCGVQVFDGAFSHVEGCSGVDAMGPSASGGVLITASATTNTKGSYSQITASTARDYIGFFGIFDLQGVNTGYNALYDIAIGGAGSELIIIPNKQLTHDFTWAFTNEVLPFTPINIPAGTRIAARMQSDVASAVAGLSLYGVYA